MNIGKAVKALKAGKKVRRKIWDKHEYLEYRERGILSFAGTVEQWREIDLDAVLEQTSWPTVVRVRNSMVEPWFCMMDDLLAEDWVAKEV